MVYRSTISSILPVLLIFSILLAMSKESVAVRDIPKQPRWMVSEGGTAYIPGIGRVTLPPYNFGSSGERRGSFHRYIPGADDTFIPNPGFEVPMPGRGGRIRAKASP